MVVDLYGQEVIILIDSSSSSNFISESLASKWRHWTPLNSVKQVRVANGDVLRCTHKLVDCPVWISGHGFKMTLKILPLSCYDIILGIDWLEGHNPMEVDWKQKWMSFHYLGEKIVLQGISSQLTSCELISKLELAALVHQDQLWCMVELRSLKNAQVKVEAPKEV